MDTVAENWLKNVIKSIKIILFFKWKKKHFLLEQSWSGPGREARRLSLMRNLFFLSETLRVIGKQN